MRLETAAAVAEQSTQHVYDLCWDKSSSDEFYATAGRVADEAVVAVETKARVLLDGYQRHIRFLAESPRSRGEYAIELLTLGMALHCYEGAAERTAGWIVRLARRLTRARSRSTSAKALLDWIRAGIAKHAFASALGSGARKSGSAVERMTRLVRWLEATGEFNQESKRLRNWNSFLAQFKPETATQWLQVAEELFEEFEWDAAETLGCYTLNVRFFVRREQSHPLWREDLLFRSKTAAEYHLSMVAAEVMNRGLREDFERTQERVLLVPTCMRGKRYLECRARMDGVDITCTGCDPECTVNRITKRMRAQGIAVYMVPHASGFSRVLSRWENTSYGVAAVACMLNILPGGYEMRERQIASQCVPLDFPGCRKHWDEKGFPTAVNEERLVQIAAGGR
jgi:hypothetical protein